jgi:acyl-coenzyme A synthetase/AMP-(fatty) acid ligase
MPISQLLSYSSTTFGNKVAFQSGDILVSYKQLHDDVETVAHHLAAAGVYPGQIVGVYVRESAAHWCVLLALMRLGAVSVSLTSRCQEEIEAVPHLSTVICAEGRPTACNQTVQLIEIKADWFKAASDHNRSLPLPEEAERHLGRICFTSGTAGKPKAIYLDAATLKRRLSRTADRSRLHAQSILWCGLGPDTAYGFTATLAAWLVGGSVCFLRKPDHAYEDLIKNNVNVIIASPAALNSVLQSHPVGSQSRIDGPVIVAGGRLSVRLRDLLLANICSEVLLAYGSSETGGVTLADAHLLDHHPGAIGSAFSDVQVQVVDDRGQILPSAAQGLVRIKTDSSVVSYLNDQVATAQHFSEGWFYPGDVARISGEGLIILLGREADTLNIGGVKLSASEVDEAARSQPGIQDACAIIIPMKGGGVRLAIAVLGRSEAIQELPPRLRSMLPSLPPFSLVPVSNIPRNAMGKINRDDFARKIIGVLQTRGAVAEAEGFSIIQET